MKTLFVIAAGFIFVLSGTRSLATTSTVRDDIQFRQIMAGLLDNQYSAEQMAQLVVATPQRLLHAPAASTPQEFINNVDQLARQIQPRDLFQQARTLPAQGYPTADIINALRKKPITIVIFPGVFSEFIPNRAFEEVFQNTSSTSTVQWEKKVQSLGRQCDSVTSVNCDYSLAINQLKISDAFFPQKYEPIDQYINVASIDDSNHNPLVTAILFKTEGMSLETLGNLHDNTVRFTRRLEKYFSIMGVPKNLVFLGYSRGAMVALDTLSYNMGLQKPWLQNVRAMIALGGVNYGTALADDAFNPKSPNGKLLAAVQNLLNQLTDVDTTTLEKAGYKTQLSLFKERQKLILQNGILLGKFLAIANSTNPKSLYSTATTLGEQLKGTDVKAALAMIVGEIKNLGTYKVTSGFDGFSILRRQVTLLCRSIIAAVSGMQTSARLQWWATHNLPLNVDYYAISATMGHALIHNKLAYRFDSVDERMLLGDYDDYRQISGVPINDSQMAVERVKFWPELNGMLNRQNASMRTHFLGVLGTSHWGLALAVVNHNADGGVNPYPRVKLLEALAAKIAMDSN